MSRWFRHYAGMCSDPKFGGIARRAKVSRDRAVFVFAFILETAAERNASGAYDWDADSVADLLNCETDEIERVYRELIAAGMIESECVSKWSTRQHESDKDATNAERQARYKARRKANGNGGNAPVTGGGNESNAPVETDTETEKKETTTDVVVAQEPAPKPVKAVRSTKARTSMDPDLKPTMDDARVAREHGMSGPEMAREWPQWKNHHIAKGSLMASWPASWGTWCSNFEKFKNARGSPRQPVGSLMAQVANGTYRGNGDEYDSSEYQSGQTSRGTEPPRRGSDRALPEPGGDDSAGPLLDLRVAGASWG